MWAQTEVVSIGVGMMALLEDSTGVDTVSIGAEFDRTIGTLARDEVAGLATGIDAAKVED